MQDDRTNDRPEGPGGGQLTVTGAGPLRAAGAIRPLHPAALTASPSALDLARSLRRRWLLALALALVAVPGATALAWYGVPRLMPLKRVVRTTLHVASQQPTISPLAPAEGRLDFATYQRTQIALVKSRLVLNAAMRDPKVAGLALLREQANPTQWLETQLKVDYTIAPEILCISLIGEQSDELAILVEAVRDAYLREIVERQQHEQNTRLERLKEFYAAKEKIVSRRRQTLRGLAQAIGSNDAFTLARMQQYLLDRLGTAEKELMQLRSELRKAQVEDSVQASREKAAKTSPVPAGAVEELVAKDPVFIQYQLDVARREEELEKVKRLAVAGDADPNVQRATAALKTAREVLASRREKLRPEITRQLREKAGHDLETSAALRRERVAVLKVLEQELNKEVKGLETEVSRVKKGAVEVEAVRAELAEEEDLLRRLRSQVQALTMELQAPSRVTILENVTVTSKANRRALLTAAAGIGGLALVLLGVGWMEFRIRRVNGTHEVVDGLGIRLVGAIPALTGRSARQAKAANKEIYYRNRVTESVDMTRAVLVRAAQNGSVRVVMITSALPGEGKTSLSCQLAASLAAAGFNTLLIDGDLRRPTVHRMFELDEGPGFNELLRGEADLGNVLRQVPVPGLTVIGGGRWESGTTRALARGRVEQLLAGVRQQYDFILIDSSPVLPVTDPLLIGQQADAVLFSVLRDVSRLPSVYAAYQRVQALGIRILGAVVSGTHENSCETTYQGAAAEAVPGPA